MRAWILASIALLVGTTAACSSGPKLDPLPASVDLAKAPTTTIRMTAKKFDFEPADVHVKAGTLVTLEVTSIDGTHGIAIEDYGIDVRLEEGVTNTVRFYAPAPGVHDFRCSHFCGLGHRRMKGRIVVE
jgi:cytochrome c oxidase subunit 2